jgi:RHS repeat-associated protein
MYSSTAYAPFGEPYAQAGTTDLSFTGQDTDTVPITTNGTIPAMYDFLARKYPPVQGRWISPDPSGLGSANPANPQSWNRYAYVLNNPMGLIDPLGLDCVYAYDDGSTYTASGDCSLTDNGYYVDGSVGCTGWNCGGVAYNPDTDFLLVNYTPDGGDPTYWSNQMFTLTVSGTPETVTVTPAIGPPMVLYPPSVFTGAPPPNAAYNGTQQQQQNQQPSRLKDCAKAYYGFNTASGAAQDATRVGTLIAAAPLPKSWLSSIGIRTTTFAGGSDFTSILSVLGQGAGTAASGTNLFRIAGRWAGPIAIASGVIDATAIGICASDYQGWLPHF